jgi:integrase
MFEADELRAIIDGMLVVGEGGPSLVKPDATLRAMILLGINCGFGNADCAGLKLDALDLAGGWIDFPRPKTGIARRCPLWPETVAALRAAAEERRTDFAVYAGRNAASPNRISARWRGGANAS